MTAVLDGVADHPPGDAAAPPHAETGRESATASEDVGDRRSVSVRRRNHPWFLSPFGYLPPTVSGGAGPGAQRRP